MPGPLPRARTPPQRTSSAVSPTPTTTPTRDRSPRSWCPDASQVDITAVAGRGDSGGHPSFGMARPGGSGAAVTASWTVHGGQLLTGAATTITLDGNTILIAGRGGGGYYGASGHRRRRERRSPRQRPGRLRTARRQGRHPWRLGKRRWRPGRRRQEPRRLRRRRGRRPRWIRRHRNSSSVDLWLVNLSLGLTWRRGRPRASVRGRQRTWTNAPRTRLWTNLVLRIRRPPRRARCALVADDRSLVSCRNGCRPQTARGLSS
jgi:hypothetical protein